MVIVSLFDQYGKGNEDACVLIKFHAFILTLFTARRRICVSLTRGFY